MRLLIASQHFWPESFRINDFARTLRAHGCEVTVLTGQPNYPEGRIYPGYKAASLRRESWEGIDILRVPLIPRGNAGSLRLAANYLSYLVSATLFGGWGLRGRRFDAILVYGTSPILQAIPAIVLRRRKGARLVTWVQDLWPESLSVTGHVKNGLLLRLVDSVVRWIYRHNDLLLGQSSAFVDAVKRKAPGVPVLYFPNPGEASLAQDRTPRDFGPGFHIVFAGNIGKAQALKTIIAAADKVQSLEGLVIHMFGSGSQLDWLRTEVERLELSNIRLHGRVSADEMPTIFGGADVLLVTLGKDEILAQTVPSKVQAYLQAGRPMIAALDGEGALVAHRAGAGLVTPAEDAVALAGAMQQMYRTPIDVRNGFGDAGRRYFEQHFDPDILAARLIELLANAGKYRAQVPAKEVGVE